MVQIINYQHSSQDLMSRSEGKGVKVVNEVLPGFSFIVGGGLAYIQGFERSISYQHKTQER